MENFKDREKWIRSKENDLKYALLRTEHFIKVIILIKQTKRIHHTKKEQNTQKKKF